MSDRTVVTRPPRRPRALRAALFGLLAALALSAPHVSDAAPRVRAWTPAGMDSLSEWAVRAREDFRSNTGDSLGATNFIAYQLVGRIGRSLLGSLGRGNLSQAYAIESVIDSLGLDTEVSTDVSMPFFALLMVRNPYNSKADVAGFLYWYVQNELHYQGVRFTSGRNLLMRVWRTRDPEKPFSWGILENTRYGSLPLQFSLMRMAKNGLFWTAEQYPGMGPDMGGRGDASFADLNNDGVPELVTWTHATGDSMFTECRECPGLLTERTWSERESGFELIESRLMPTAYANFVLFIRLLREGNRIAAARLLANPAKLSEAIANGWDKGTERGIWRVLNVEPDETWPHWMVVRFGAGVKSKSWVVNFVVKDGRWIIRDWVLEKPAPRQVQAH